uniref:Uncharacterized protein n=1 Tax=Fibrocapsa japonica TaxID=94617 RepID=A0A7S2XWK5_9STRA
MPEAPPDPDAEEGAGDGGGEAPGDGAGEDTGEDGIDPADLAAYIEAILSGEDTTSIVPGEFFFTDTPTLVPTMAPSTTPTTVPSVVAEELIEDDDHDDDHDHDDHDHGDDNLVLIIVVCLVVGGLVLIALATWAYKRRVASAGIAPAEGFVGSPLGENQPLNRIAPGSRGQPCPAPPVVPN